MAKTRKTNSENETVCQIPLSKLSINRWGQAINPPITPDDLEAMRASIQRDGVMTPLIAWRRNGKYVIVAGNNRYRIAKSLNLKRVPVILRSYASEDDAKRFSITDNLARRHMLSSQRAELALQLQNIFTVGRGRRTDLCIERTKVNARAEAAKQAGVSPVSMSQMQRVLNSNDASLIDSVRNGRMRLASAVRLIADLKPYTPSKRPVVFNDEPVFSCVHGDNSDLIAGVARLYLRPGMIVADITYGRGMFWQKVDTSSYAFHASDLHPQSKMVKKMDLRKLVYADGTVDVCVLDPPYFSRSGKNSVYARRYRTQYAPKCYEDLVRLYKAGMRESYRVLKPGGLLWLKCADDVQKGVFRAALCDLLEAARRIGFSAIDTFVLARSSNGLQINPSQRHSRRNHSYLLVLAK